MQTAEQDVNGSELPASEVRNEVRAALEEPFDPELLYWKPQVVSKNKDRALVAVYADPRAYIDRLNEVLGPEGWSDKYETSVIPYVPRNKYVTSPEAPSHPGAHKLIIICTVAIPGMGQHSSFGESETDDENAATSAEAQAFKRACTKFGLGRYLYSFPKGIWCPYDDKKKQVTQPPVIPDWAYPRRPCEDCEKQIVPFQYERRVVDEGGTDRSETVEMSVSEIIQRSKAKHSKALCAECMRKRADEVKKTTGGRL